MRRSSVVSQVRAGPAALVASLLILLSSGCEGGGVTPSITQGSMQDAAEAGIPTDADRSPQRPVGASCTRDSDCAHELGRCLSEIDPGAALHGVWSLLRDVGVKPLGAVDEDAGVGLPADPELGVTAPGGYCSAPCRRNEDCGRGAACLSSEEAFRLFSPLAPDASAGGFIGEGTGVCLEPCDRDADCRLAEGYVCRSPLQNIATVNGTAALPLTGRPFYCLPPAPPL